MAVDSSTLLKLSHVRTGELPFSMYWVSAHDEHNADILNFRNHHHTFYELHVLMEGWVEYTVKDRSFRMQKGEFLWIPSGCVHRVDGWGTGFVKATIVWNPHQPIPSDDTLLRPRPMPAEMLAEAERLFTNAAAKSAYRAEFTSLSVGALILRAAEYLGVSMATHTEENHDDRVLKAKMLMQDNPDIFFTCEELARYCGVSVKQLGRLFRQYEGKGLLEYIHDQKIETAKRMLLESDVPQKVMAQRLGFSDYRYYAHFFSRMTGVTPSEYQKRDILDE